MHEFRLSVVPYCRRIVNGDLQAETLRCVGHGEDRFLAPSKENAAFAQQLAGARHPYHTARVTENFHKLVIRCAGPMPGLEDGFALNEPWRRFGFLFHGT